jgi:hypothetical protein
MHELVPRLLMGLLGVALIAGGGALAIDLRGVSTWHSKKLIESLAWLEVLLRRIPPWKSLLRRPLENRVRNQVMLTRFIGASFAAVGMIMLLRPPSVTSQSRPDSERSPYWLPLSRTPASAFSTP